MVKRITIYDVAKEASVSITAVSQILNWPDTHRYSAKTTKRIFRAVKKLGYIPSPGRRGRFCTVGLVLNTDIRASYIPLEMLFGIVVKLRDSGYKLNIIQIPGDTSANKPFIPALHMEYQVDGIISNYGDPGLPGSWLELMENHHIPVVYMNVAGHKPVVRPDDFSAGQLAVEKLSSLGHKRIVYVNHPTSTHHSAEERSRGCRTACARLGIDLNMGHGDEIFKMAPEAVAELIAGKACRKKPSAAICYRSDEALSFIRRLHSLNPNSRIPEDLSIISLDLGSEQTLHRDLINLSGYYFDWNKIGCKSAELILKAMNAGMALDKSETNEVILEPPIYFGGETTASKQS